MKRWDIIQNSGNRKSVTPEKIISILLKNRGLRSKKEIDRFLSPQNPDELGARDVHIDKISLRTAIKRITKAIEVKESIIVYADYDADGITAGAIMWETLHSLGAHVMPYIPHRVEEGYGLSKKGIDAVYAEYKPTLIITVDHGITAHEKVAYAQSLGIDVIVTDHHVKPAKIPDCTIIHTTKLSGSGVSWFLAKELLNAGKKGKSSVNTKEILILATIGTIADLVPLIGPNRSITKYGLEYIRSTTRVGIDALLKNAGLEKRSIGTYEISHMLAPRLNAMGRIEHALDALRLLCTHQKDKADLLAQKLGLTNKERQQMTVETTLHALNGITSSTGDTFTKKLIFISHESYNQGVIGLVAGKLVEKFYRPAIVIAKGEKISKASARSIAGFNIVEAIRSCSDILIDVGGHPMAAGFTVETQYLSILQSRLENLAERDIGDEKLVKTLKIDMDVPLIQVTDGLWKMTRALEPFGFGNPEPIFVTHGVKVLEARLVGSDGKHLKLRIQQSDSAKNIQPKDAIAFGFGEIYGKIQPDIHIDIAYTVDMNEWNGSKKLQLKIKDIHLPS